MQNAQPRASSSHGPSVDDVDALAQTFVKLVRSAGRARQQFIAAAKHNVEWWASVIISCVANEGPLRAGAVAEMVQSDPSTISRQVAALVKDGLLERLADPVDGRASLLAVTPKGREVFREHKRVRDAHFATMLGDWNERDIRRLTELMQRFADDYDRYRPRFFAEKDAASREES